MPKRVMNTRSGAVADVLGETDQFYWLTSGDAVKPWTSNKEGWGEVGPKAGDVWEAKGGGVEFRVLGVDDVNNVFLIVRKERYDGGGWPTPFDGGIQVDAEMPSANYVYVRRLPERYLTLKSRLGSETAK